MSSKYLNKSADNIRLLYIYQINTRWKILLNDTCFLYNSVCCILPFESNLVGFTSKDSDKVILLEQQQIKSLKNIQKNSTLSKNYSEWQRMNLNKSKKILLFSNFDPFDPYENQCVRQLMNCLNGDKVCNYCLNDQWQEKLVYLRISVWWPVAYSEPCQTSKMECFPKIFHDFQPLTVCAKTICPICPINTTVNYLSHQRYLMGSA